MTKSEDGIGRRIAMYRKLCGFKNTFELADQIDNPRVTHAVIANIESGRRKDPSVSEVIEIARGLGISPLFLLAPALTPTAQMDLTNVSDDVSRISSDAFMRWFMLEDSELFRREIPQLNLYQTFKNVQLLFKLQKASQKAREKVKVVSNEIPYRRVLAEQAWEQYQIELHDWYNLLMTLTNVQSIDLSWTDESLIKDIDLDFQPTESPRYSREGRFNMGSI